MAHADTVMLLGNCIARMVLQSYFPMAPGCGTKTDYDTVLTGLPLFTRIRKSSGSSKTARCLRRNLMNTLVVLPKKYLETWHRSAVLYPITST